MTTYDRDELGKLFDSLTITSQLFLETLAARARLGETTFTFDSRCRTAARVLDDMGLIWWKEGNIEKTIIAGLESKGLTMMLSPNWTRPEDEARLRIDLSNAYKDKDLLDKQRRREVERAAAMEVELNDLRRELEKLRGPISLRQREQIATELAHVQEMAASNQRELQYERTRLAEIQQAGRDFAERIEQIFGAGE